MPAARARPIVVVVVGSINIDLVCRTPRFPRAGETIIGGDLHAIPGGKGANQAVAAARLGANVHMVGRVGDDSFGPQLIVGLRTNHVNVDHVHKTPGVASGCAMILIDRGGENSIVVSPGANAQVTQQDVDAAEHVIRRAAVVVLQLEIPIATVLYTIAMCRKHGVVSILDPAPVPARGALPREAYRVDVFTPNEHEAKQLVRSRASKPDALARALLSRGCRRVVLKLGKRGSLTRGQDGPCERAKSVPVKVVDTTAAGDAFTGALAVAIAEGRAWNHALHFANAAGALCCTKLGAQPALPTRGTVERLMLAGPGVAAIAPGKPIPRRR